MKTATNIGPQPEAALGYRDHTLWSPFHTRQTPRTARFRANIPASPAVAVSRQIEKHGLGEHNAVPPNAISAKGRTGEADLSRGLTGLAPNLLRVGERAYGTRTPKRTAAASTSS